MTLLDIGIVLSFFIFTFYIGLRERSKLSLAGYWVNDRSTTLFPLIATSLSSFVGAASIFGNSSIANSGGGLPMFIVPLSYLAYFVLFSYWLVPKIKQFGDNKKAYTLPDFLEARYNRSVRYAGAAVILVSWLLYLALQMLSFGVFVSAVTNFHPNLATILAAIVVILYTAVGGIRADIRTDIFQFIVMIVLLLIFVPIVMAKVTLVEVFTKMPDSFFVGSDVAPSYVWVAAFFFLGSAVLASPDLWVRAYAAKDQVVAKRAFLISGILVTVFMGAAVLLGIYGKVLLPEVSSDHILPTMLKTYLSPGLFGLIAAGFFAAIMSTADTIMLIISMTLVRDLYQPIFNPTMNEDQLFRLSRKVILIVGLISLIVALVIFNMVHLTLQAVSFYAALLPAVIFGFLYPSGGAIAAKWSIILGFITILLLVPWIPTQAFIPGVLVSFSVFGLLTIRDRCVKR